MPLRFFHKIDDSNGNPIINAFEDWFATHNFDFDPQAFFSFLKNGTHAAAPLTGAEGPLESAATAVPANSPLQYFIKVDGVTGDATLKGFEGWFSVDGFDWSVQNTTSSTSSGAGAGKTTFSPLTVDIHSLTGLTSLLSDVARGQSLGTVELAAVDTTKGQTLKVYDIKLSDVVLGGFENDPGPNGIETALAFDFAKVAVTVTPPTQNGRPGVPQTGAFDVTGAATDALASDVAADAVTGTNASLASAATPVPANSPLQYFIKVNGATGDATLKGFEGWFSVDGFDWGVQDSRTTSTGSGGGAGKTTFSPLTVDVHSLSGLAALFSDAARGDNLGTVELAAVDTIKGQTLKVYDLKLSDVVLDGFENDPGPNGIETALAFDFAKVAVTVTPPTQNGRPGVPQTGEFDVTGAATEAVANDVIADAVTTSQVSLASAATPVPANSPLQYFIKVDGATGDSTLKGFEGWFSVDGFDWGVQNTTSSTSSGAGAGKTTFSPLTVDVHSLSGLAALFSDAARGDNLGTIELAAVDTIKGQTLKVYDLKLSDVFVGGFENDPGPNGIETALAFDFAKVAVTVTPPTQNGQPGVPQTGAFDVTGAATDAVANDFLASAVTTTQVSLASAATPVPANSPLQYFIKVDGATGDSTLKGFEGWFAVDGFDWGVQDSRTTSTGGGGGAGKTTFSPLTVDIHSLSGLASLFSDAARGENLGTVELAAVDTVKGQTLKVYDLKLSDVVLGGFENDPGPNGVETALAFDFAKVAVTVTPPTQNGQPGVPQTGAFDVTGAATDAVANDILASAVTTTQVSLASAATPVPANSPLRYFIKVDGATGDSTLKGFEGWFSVDGFDWGAQNTTSSTSSGGGAGKTTFSPLTVDIHSLSGLASLFSDAARGDNLGTVELAAVDTVKGQTLKVYDIKLSDVFVGGFENDPGPNGVETALAFDFGKINVTVQPQSPNGSLGVPQTAAFDATGAATDALASASIASPVTTTQLSLASAATPVPADSPLQYFLKVDGAAGDATLKGFEGWFSVDGFDWGAQNTTSSTSSGGGAGKTTFSPLTVDIHSLSGLATLFSDAAKGENLGTVEFAAVDTVRGQSLKVYDIKLSDVVLTGFENDPGPNGVETALAFDFAKVNVTVQPPTQRGSLGPPQTAGVDLSPNDLLFDPASNGPGAIQGALVAPDSLASLTPGDLTWRPTLSTQS